MVPGFEQYDVKVLLLLAKAIDGEKTDYFKWLAQNNYKELAAFCNMLQDDVEAEQWLTQNGHQWLGIVSHAIDGADGCNKSATCGTTPRQWLLHNMHPANLMFALACRGEERAVYWLKKQQLDILIILANSVSALRKKQELDTAFPYKMRF
ncbi:MAG: hypothetical protein J6X62_02260 [Bacteroidales bacterium]|nr:hypothetical protein [Bacteroidales bacterium]